MEKNYPFTKLWTISFIIIAGVFLLASCGGNPATSVGGGDTGGGIQDQPPVVTGPPAEAPMPIALKFVNPQDLKLDFATLSLEEQLIKAIDPTGQYSAAISYTYHENETFFNDYLGPLMAGLEKIDMPYDTARTFHTRIDFGYDRYIYADTVLVGEHDIKIDFADYDFDNDGVAEGCSGNSQTLPICVRMWVDDKRYLAWVYETFPYWDFNTNTANEIPGLGRFKIVGAQSIEHNGGNYTATHVDYDRQSDLHTSFDAFGWGINVFSLRVTGIHIQIGSDVGADVDAAKLVKRYGQNYAIDMDGDSQFDTLGNYLSRYREGYDFWSGSTTNGLIFGYLGLWLDLNNQCAVISTGNGTDTANCDNVGGERISVGEIDPITGQIVVAPGNLQFPSVVVQNDVTLDDFPNSPPVGLFSPLTNP